MDKKPFYMTMTENIVKKLKYIAYIRDTNRTQVIRDLIEEDYNKKKVEGK